MPDRNDVATTLTATIPSYLYQEYNDDDEKVSYWRTTEGAWFTRQEAEEWARSHHYRLGKWRVYGIGARGVLKRLLKAHTNYAA